MNLKGRDYLKLLDFTSEEIEYLINLAADLKEKILHSPHLTQNKITLQQKIRVNTFSRPSYPPRRCRTE